ncbi:hypothetical protein ABKN59_000708 [Abortiporus biennis]
MLANSTHPPVLTTAPNTHCRVQDPDPFVMYSKSLHDYTLRLWTESRRMAEDKARQRAAAKKEEAERRAAANYQQ